MKIDERDKQSLVTRHLPVRTFYLSAFSPSNTADPTTYFSTTPPLPTQPKPTYSFPDTTPLPTLPPPLPILPPPLPTLPPPLPTLPTPLPTLPTPLPTLPTPPPTLPTPPPTLPTPLPTLLPPFPWHLPSLYPNLDYTHDTSLNPLTLDQLTILTPSPPPLALSTSPNTPQLVNHIPLTPSCSHTFSKRSGGNGRGHMFTWTPVQGRDAD
ncbi:hypothetical protein Pmani_037292 [Petrolisthes manimaculis]|uniref:Uncharacterized protein n=1 Tax=Petrolisthes manimaculis TaxID=1843537 RepID=A0AAE1NGM3_9EUCA|nr:hypothetical protein Pmani_037292 [Petrolisthes manimaculis]